MVDLAAAYRLQLLSDGLAERAAARISAALLPGDMVELIEGGERSLEAARAAIEWATRYGDGSGAERGQMLKRGDVVELEVERLGVLRNRVV